MAWHSDAICVEFQWACIGAGPRRTTEATGRRHRGPETARSPGARDRRAAAGDATGRDSERAAAGGRGARGRAQVRINHAGLR